MLGWPSSVKPACAWKARITAQAFADPAVDLAIKQPSVVGRFCRLLLLVEGQAS